MKKLALLLAALLLISLCACKSSAPSESAPATTEAPTEATATPEVTEAPTEATLAPTEPAGPQIMDLVGSWQRTHTEVEGDRQENTNATITVSGDSQDALTITFEDKEFPDDNFQNKALTAKEGELYTDCENNLWYMEVAHTDRYSYTLTLLDSTTLLLRCYFEVDGMPMVAHQWFTRIG